jgi:CHAD domain-containing protein
VSTDFNKLLRRLDEEYLRLSNGYSEDALHQFRVILRRLRSLLRHDTGRKVRKLRCQLGKLARTTNAARDWDTLVGRAHASLGAAEFSRVQPLLEARRAECHMPVLDLLRSERWPKARRALKKTIKAQGDALAVDLRSDAGLRRVQRRASRAWRAVQDVATDRAWHKLRITIKDLRYRLKALPADHRTPSIVSLLALSKRVQESLGVWHDSVVHVQRVQALCDAPEVQNQPELLGILHAWCRQLEREAQHARDTAAADLAEHGDSLLDQRVE